MHMRVTVCRREHFNAAHRIFNPEWDNKKNFEIFGKCSYPNYHGHNYDLIVKVTGETDAKTGYVMDLGDLKDIIWKYVLDRFDHRNLNLDVEEFRSLIPTAENIATVIWKILRKHINSSMDLKVVLYETERNFVEYSGD